MARVLLALISATFGYFAVTRAFAQAAAAAHPELAHRLAPEDGGIAGRLARALSGPEATPAQRALADVVARRALRHNAASVAAVSSLGIDAQIRADLQTARRLFGYAQFLSRRDLQTQLWAIEDRVAANDIPGALEHYDAALRIKPAMSEILFPILTSASTDPEIGPALVRKLAANPPWAYSFTYHVAMHSSNPRATLALFSGLRRAGFNVASGADARALNKLIASGGVEEAWAHYSATHPAAQRNRSRDPRFTADLDTPTRFDWIAINRDGIAAAVQSNAAGGYFDFSVPMSAGGPVLEQMELLPAGDYRLVGRSSGIDQTPRSRPYWLLSCGDRQLGLVEIPNSALQSGTFSGRFQVPPGCPVQMLTLVVRSSDSMSGVSGQIIEAQLQPVGN